MMLDILVQRFRNQGLDCEAIRLREYEFSPCTGCEACRRDQQCHGHADGMQALYPKILKYRGMVLVSPTHHYNITAWMKAFIDRMYCFYRFEDGVPRPWSSSLAGQGRVAAVVSVCEQIRPEDMGFTLEAMRLPLAALGYEVIGQAAIYGLFEKAGVAARPEAVRLLWELADRFVCTGAAGGPPP